MTHAFLGVLSMLRRVEEKEKETIMDGGETNGIKMEQKSMLC